MNVKYQTIKRFAQKEGLNLTETVKSTGTASLTIVSGNYTTTISKNASTDAYEIKVVNECGRRLISAIRFTQKAVVECLKSDDFAEYIVAEAEAGNEPADAEEVPAVEVLDTAQLKKELQRGIKEIRTQHGLNADMLKVSYTDRQQEQGFFTIGTGVRVLEQYGDVINAFCEKYGTYVATEQGTYKHSRRLRFKVRTADVQDKEEQEVEAEVIETPEGAEVSEESTNELISIIGKNVKTELKAFDGLHPATLKLHNNMVEQYGKAYVDLFTPEELESIDSTTEPVALKTYKMNKELSEQLYNKHSKTIQIQMRYNNTFEVVSEDMDVWNKVHSGSWAVCYGFMQLRGVPNLYVRHTFLLNEHDEVVDVTQFCMSELHTGADYHVVKEYRTMTEYLDALMENSGRPDLDTVLAEGFKEYEKAMYRLGNTCIG